MALGGGAGGSKGPVGAGVKDGPNTAHPETVMQTDQNTASGENFV
jgi:hypothetical protein